MFPLLVREAIGFAAANRFESSCTPEVGRLLRTLAGCVRGGNVGEIGSGFGVGTAWLASGLGKGRRLVTVERDAPRWTAVHYFFNHSRVTALLVEPSVEALHGDWRAILAHGPFALLFVDVAEAKGEGANEVVAALAPGGLAVLDDLTPEEHWPEDWRGKPDPVREFWLNDTRLHAVEIRLTATTAAILATRTDGS
jgi:predicted O-methyltransferase YrrM